MPIDVRLLRNPDDVARVVHWHSLRRIGNEKVVESVRQLDEKFREAQREVNTYKSSCRQQRKRPDPDHLQSLQANCDGYKTNLETKLCRLANTVDETLLQELDPYHHDPSGSSDGASFGSSALLRSPFRHLIEAAAYECLGNNLPSGLFCPTGLAVDWAQAIAQSLLESLTVSTRLCLPNTLPLSAQQVQGMMGSTERTTTASHESNSTCCNSSVVLQAPSWLGYLQQHHGDQTLGDKQLPFVVHYTTQTTTNVNNITGLPRESQPFTDKRELWRQDSWSSSSCPILPPQLASLPTSQHEVIILTSSTYYDSRAVQKEWTSKLVTFYQSLVTATSTTQTIVRQRVVKPAELLPAEASRIVIEGQLPSDGSNKTSQHVILAYLSNFSDYPTRACRVKNTPQQFCHVLQGVVCSVVETMCWQASHGRQDERIQLPSSLSRYLQLRNDQQEGVIVLPAIKRLGKTKHGRLQLKVCSKVPLAPPKMNEDQQQKTHQPCSKGNPTSDSMDTNNNHGKRRQPPRINTDLLLEPSTATQERIRAEALSSPFGFLPFYH